MARPPSHSEWVGRLRLASGQSDSRVYSSNHVVTHPLRKQYCMLTEVVRAFWQHIGAGAELGEGGGYPQLGWEIGSEVMLELHLGVKRSWAVLCSCFIWENYPILGSSYLCSKSPTYKWVLFSEHICKSKLFIKSNQVSLRTQLKQSAIQYCTVIGL